MRLLQSATIAVIVIVLWSAIMYEIGRVKSEKTRYVYVGIKCDAKRRSLIGYQVVTDYEVLPDSALEMLQRQY
jgi:hypothetical protein